MWINKFIYVDKIFEIHDLLYHIKENILREKNKLKIKNPNVFYVANKKDIIENNDYLKFVRIVRGIDFIDVETTEGEKRFIEIKDAINFIKTRL